jgi:glycine/D-amino acid oxidase-like deaminating enzyme
VESNRLAKVRSLASNRFTVDYLTRTADGRILFGSRGAPYAFGSRISDQQDVHEPTFNRVHRAVVEWFPTLRGIHFTHNWGGPVGVPRDWMPSVQFDLASRLGIIRGYTGQGVATSNLAGRLLSSLIGNCPSGLEKLPLAHHIPQIGSRSQYVGWSSDICKRHFNGLTKL